MHIYACKCISSRTEMEKHPKKDVQPKELASQSTLHHRGTGWLRYSLPCGNSFSETLEGGSWNCHLHAVSNFHCSLQTKQNISDLTWTPESGKSWGCVLGNQ